MNALRGFLPLFAAIFCLTLTGCNVHTATGPTQHESSSIERDAAKTLRTELRMAAGTLKVGGGSPKWMQADFTYNVPSWKPNVRYTAGDLLIEQPDSGGIHTGGTTNEWSLQLNDEIPTDLTARVGAGEARLNLGSLSLRSLDIEMGAGELRLDLRGNPRHDYDVKVRGGAGEATVYLPKDAGIYAKATGGLGEIKVRGLRAEGDHWINDAYGSSKVQLRVDVQGGVGQINLIAD